jgi:hypothetical protein
MKRNDSDLLAILQLAYDRKYVLDIDDALDALKIILKAKYVVEGYNDKYQPMSESKHEVSIKVVTAQSIKESILEKSLENGNAKS